MMDSQATNSLASASVDMPEREMVSLFPSRIREMIGELARVENFPVSLLVGALVSAAATAVGNAVRVHIKGEWSTAPVLYIMLVARAGVGKSPVLQFAFRPIRQVDSRLLGVYRRERKEWLKRNIEDPDEADRTAPLLCQYVISDFTPEAMVRAHQGNLRGIVLVVDELIGMYNSVGRYSGGTSLAETQLSNWSGEPVKVNRCSLDEPIYIERPCVGIVGGTQPSKLPELVKAGYDRNGLMDRYIFIDGSGIEVPHWSEEQPGPTGASEVWASVIEKLMALPLDVDHPAVIDMTPEARRLFFSWHNATVDSVNAGLRGDDTRFAKVHINAARIALVLQLLKWACGEDGCSAVSLDSVGGAITLVEHWEKGYTRLMAGLNLTGISDREQEWLESLPQTFTTAMALESGTAQGLVERTVYKRLREYLTKGILSRPTHGNYQKNL